MFGMQRILGRWSGPSRVMAMACVLLGLVGCGQKGPLYLPSATPTPAKTSDVAPARLPDAPQR
ncbi:lipoprotein [Hydrogenophaga sp.]|uniref:LPS translocon maturation chaperone LptM n=1 Tax=Hydrogenophaga sp. TaxID=1904254 RepID=UPI0035AFE874